MKCKRILSMLLTLCMVMSLFAGTTVTASAADGASVTTRTIPLDVSTLSQITDTAGNQISPTTDSNGDSIYSCEAEGWSYRLNQSKQIYELTLSGVNFDIKNTDLGWAIIAPKVILADGTENRVSTVSSNKTVAAINTQEITGSGSLTVSATSTSTESGAACYGIYATQDLTLDQCSIVVDGVKCSSNNGSASGIFAAMSKTLTIKANAAKDNKITIKNVQGTLTSRALGALKPIVAEGAFVSGAKDAFTSGSTKTIYFKDPNVPVIVSFVELPSEPEAAVFADGFGNTVEDTASYVEGTTTNDKGYTFAGWFDEQGNELASAADAVAGKTYTAKWTKNGKTVRTAVLDLTVISESNTFGATLTDGVYTNADEGWSWNTATNTLTLSGCNFNIVDTTGTNGFMAIKLPAKSTINLESETENIVVSSSTKQSGAIGAATSLTIEGDGTLGITSSFTGIMAGGNIAINSPITVKSTSNEEYAMAIAIESENEDDTITIADTLEITKPVGGKIHSSGKTILDSNGGVAKEVVISAKGGSTETPTFNDGFGKTIENATSYEKGTTTNDKGYTFAGWFDEQGNALASADDAVAGKTYTAKWTKNGKTVRTTALDFYNDASNEWKTGCTQEDTLWSNAAEGWSWDTASQTLTLNGVTIDAQLDENTYGAIQVFGDATIITANGTENFVCSRSEDGENAAIFVQGDLAIIGNGKLTVVGEEAGIYAEGNIAINAPITATSTGTSKGCGAILAEGHNNKVEIKIDSSLSIVQPVGGRALESEGVAWIAAGNNEEPVSNVVIASSASQVTELTLSPTYWYPTAVGEKLTLTATIPDSYDLARWVDQEGYIELAAGTDASKGGTDTHIDTAVTVELKQPCWGMIQISAGPNGGTQQSATCYVKAGHRITIDPKSDGSDGNGLEYDYTFNNPYTLPSIKDYFNVPDGKRFKAWSVNGAEYQAGQTVTIPVPEKEKYGSLTITAVWEEIPVTTYTVTYNSNGGSAVGSATVSEGHKLTAPEAPTKDGYTFQGWYKDAAFTNSWNFDTDTVTGNTTLYAKWAETAKLYGISGTVYASDGTTTASGVSVKLMKGDKQVASATSDSNGAYSFTGVAPGVYNIVAEKDDTTQTTLVIVTNHNETGKNVTLPQSKVNSKLTVNGADTPDVVAGGLDKEAAAVKADNSGATSVKVEMTVESKRSADIDPADKTNIETSASGKTLEYLDIKVTQTVDSNVSPITLTENMMEIVIPYDMTGKSNITVYRNHNGSAAAFTQLSTRPVSSAVDGTYYLDTANHLIYVYTQKFSTYAIGYNTQSGGGSGSGGSSSGGGSSSSSGGSSSGNSSTISTPSAKNGTVSVSPKSASKGTTVTVTVTPDKGYVLETLTVTDASGKKLDLKNLGSGKYSFTMPASKVEVKATFMEDNTMLNYFVDVPASAYYYDAVLWAAEQGITGGTDATHFSPDGVCTRAQAVTFLWRAAGSPAPSATAMPFTDVAADSYYYNAVLWAMENGITVGTSSTTFSPDLKCSRAHIMTFLWRSEKSPAAGSVNPFTDVSADAYYADAVLWAVKESVTSGTSPAAFSPDADCTRAQIVTFIWRTLAR